MSTASRVFGRPFRQWRVVVLAGFAAGVIGTLAFHQVALGLLHDAGLTPRTAFAMTPTRPWQVPAVLSLAFWGGLWGIALAAALIGRAGARGYWVLASAFGALAPTAVSWLVVAPLRGHPLGNGWRPDEMLTALLVNAAWGLGTALLIRPSIGGAGSRAAGPPCAQKKAPGQGG